MKPGLLRLFVAGSLVVSTTGNAAIFCVETVSQLHDAFSQAEANGQDDIVRLQQGTYLGTFELNSTEAFGLDLLGGYTAGCAGRVIDPGNTVLNGDGSGRALYVLAENGGNVLLEGITVSNGVDYTFGGGAYVRTQGNVTLRQMDFQDNTGREGGGCFIDSGGMTTVSSSVFDSNAASGDGGGCQVDADGPIRVVDSRFSGNESESGFGGGGSFVSRSNIPSELTNNIAEGNVASIGGGLSAYGDGGLEFSGNTVVGNTARRGGGVEVGAGTDREARLADNVFSGNSAKYEGGAVFSTADDSELIASGNSLCDNSAGADGTALYVTDSPSVTLTNNAIIANRAGTRPTFFGGAVFLNLREDSDRAFIYNNIFWGNESINGVKDISLGNNGNHNQTPSPVDLYNNDFDQSAAGFYVALAFSIDASNFDNIDPMLVDTARCDLHLQNTSPVINQGNNDAPEMLTTDVDGQPRIMDGTVDMGVDETHNAANADLAITIDDSTDPIFLDDPLVYTVTVENLGESVADSVVVTNIQPQDTLFISAVPQQGGCDEEDGVVTCQLGTLPDEMRISIAVTVVPQAVGLIENEALVAAATPDFNQANNHATATTMVLEPQEPLVDIKANGADGPVLVQPGQPVSVTLAMDAGNREGDPAEWWFGYFSSFGAGFLFSALERPIADVPATEVINLPFPPGWYLLFFSVDDQLDGQMGMAWVDAIWVLVSANRNVTLAPGQTNGLPDARRYLFEGINNQWRGLTPSR